MLDKKNKFQNLFIPLLPLSTMKKDVTKKPWGSFEEFTHNKKSTVKILTVKPKQRFSLQYHKNRKEFWKLLDNPAKITIGNNTLKAKKDDEFTIPKKTNHRIQALGKEVNVLEISFGTFNEKDIVRLEDDYGRI